MMITEAGGPIELRQIASGIATQNISLINIKLKCREVDRCRLLERRVVKKLGNELEQDEA